MSKTPSPNHAVAVAWTEMVASLDGHSTLREGTPSLADYALGQFNPKAVIERLLDPEPPYFALKDILFAGLCAWTVCPNAPHLIEEAMVLAGVSRMADLEAEHQRRFPQDPFLADIIARIAGPGIDFYRDFYYPMGGLRRVLSARSPKLFGQALQAESKNIGFAVEMMRVCHYHALHLQDRMRFRRAAIKGAGEAVSQLLKASKEDINVLNNILRENRPQRSANQSNCARNATPFQESAAQSYATFSMRVGNKTLLDILRCGEANLKSHGHLLPEWLCRAGYAANTIIRPMYPRDSSEKQLIFLPTLTAIIIDPPSFGPYAKMIHEAFGENRQRLRAL